jgi:hypothetical protein
VFVNKPVAGEYQLSTTDLLNERKISLLATQPLGSDEPPVSTKPENLSKNELDRICGEGYEVDILPRLQAVVGAESVHASITFDPVQKDAPPPASFHLIGDYEEVHPFEASSDYSLTSAEGWQQNGVVIFRGRQDNVIRAVQYGSDVLRRRKETLQDPGMLRRQRIGDDRHFALFVRSTRSGETAHVAVMATGTGPVAVPVGFHGQHVPTLRQGSTIAAPARPGLVQGSHDAAMPQTPADIYPLFVGGREGFRLVEAWIVLTPKTEGAFAFKTPSLFDIQYLIEPSRR